MDLVNLGCQVDGGEGGKEVQWSSGKVIDLNKNGLINGFLTPIKFRWGLMLTAINTPNVDSNQHFDCFTFKA